MALSSALMSAGFQDMVSGQLQGSALTSVPKKSYAIWRLCIYEYEESMHLLLVLF